MHDHVPLQADSIPPMLSIRGLSKRYSSGLSALTDVDLEVRPGEIFALLGPNGAGKTTLIHIVCGIVNATAGQVLVGGLDHVRDFRATRTAVGLVPQELSTDAFESVWNTVAFSRGLFGKPRNPQYLEQVLRDLSLWDKRHSPIMTLSGGMKRRVLIAKALAHEPRLLFLDEPTAGVDVELRRDMWNLVRKLRDQGVTIILTTHYIEEAEDLADRIGIIHGGKIILVEDKDLLMKKLGQRQLILTLRSPLETIPAELQGHDLTLAQGGNALVYTFDTQTQDTGIASLLRALSSCGIDFIDLRTEESSLEDIFVHLVRTA